MARQFAACQDPYGSSTPAAKAARHRFGGHVHAPACQWHEAHPDTGLRWEDMPGKTHDRKKIHFFFHRRGWSVQRMIDGELYMLPE